MNHWQKLLAMLLSFTSGLCSSIISAEEMLDERSTAAIQTLIRDLDHDSFQRRELATRRLAEMGEAAIVQLTAALESDSAEVRFRTRQIIDEIRRPVLFTISRDGRLFRLRVGRRGLDKHLVAELGAPFDAAEVDVEGLDRSPTDGHLYAAVTFVRDDGRESKLYRIQPEGKSVTLMGHLAATEIDGLAFDKDGALYGMASAAKEARKLSLGQLLKVLPSTAEVRSVNTGLSYGDLDAFAISGSGTAVLSSCKIVRRCRFDGDLLTSTCLTGHPVGQITRQFGDIEGMAFVGDTTVYGICHRSTTGHLVRFDIEQNKCEYLGDLGFAALNLASGGQR